VALSPDECENRAYQHGGTVDRLRYDHSEANAHHVGMIDAKPVEKLMSEKFVIVSHDLTLGLTNFAHLPRYA
jgi:hypothetical protein